MRINKMTIRFALILATAFLQIGCASVPVESQSQKVFIAPEVEVQLSALSLPNKTIETEQLITANYGDQVMTFQGQVSLTPHKLLMVLYDPFGRPGITIEWSDHNIHYTKSSAVPKKLHPENILADFVIMNWPTKSVKELLASSGADVRETKNHRQIIKDGQVMIDIEYSSPSKKSLMEGRIKYHHLIWGYTLNIQSARQEQ